MIAASIAGTSAPVDAPRRTIVPAAAAVLVALLVAGTLGTVTAIAVGTGLHLLGLPDDWALAAAGATALGSLAPSAALGRQAWRAERDGIEG